MRKRYLMLFSIILIILTVGVVSAGDVDIASNDADGILNSVDGSVGLVSNAVDSADGSVDDSVDLSASVDDAINTIDSVDSVDSADGSVVDSVDSADGSVDDSVDLSASDDDIIAEDHISETYVQLNSYDLFSDNPHSINIYDVSDYVAIIHAPTESQGTAHISIGKSDDNSSEIFTCPVQNLTKQIDENNDNYTYYYILVEDIQYYVIENYYVPDLYYVLVEYKRGASSLTDFDDGYVNFVENSDHVRVEAPPEIVIGDFDNSYILIFVEGVKGNLRVLIDGKEILDDTVYNLRYINASDEFMYYIPLFLDSLSVGKHTYSVSYYGGNWDNVTISDSIDVTYLLEVNPIIDELNYDDIPFPNDASPFIYGDNVDFSILLPDDAKSGIIKVNGKSYDIFPINGIASLTLSDLELGENILNFTYDDPVYGEKSRFLYLDISPLHVPDTVLCGSNDGIRLRLPSDAQGKLNISIWDDDEYDWHFIDSVDLVNGKADYVFDADFPWTIGTHLVLVEFDGEKYGFSSENIIEIVPNIFYNNVSVGQMGALSFNMVGMRGNVTVTVNGENLTAEKLNYFGKAIVIIPSVMLNVGKNIFTVNYEGDSDFIPFAYNFGIGESIPYEYELWVEPVFNIPSEVSQNGAGYIIVELPEGTSGNMTVYINDEPVSTVPVHSGNNTISLSGLDSGDNTVKFVYVGDDGESYELYRTVNVPKKKATIDVSIPVVSQVPQFTVNLPSDATGILHAVVEGEIYRYDLKNGQATVVVPGLANGVYDVKIYYAGDSKYNAFTVNVPIIVSIAYDLKDPNLAIKAPSIYKGKKVKVTVTADKSFTGNVQVKINSKTYVVKVVNGKGTLYVSGLAVGTYTATVKFAANKIFKSSEKSVNFKVKKNVYKLSLKKVKVKRSAKKLTIKATLRINGKLAKGKKLKFKFNKRVYKAKTNKKGVAKIVIKKNVLKKLKVGKKIRYQVSYGKKVAKRKVKVRR